MGCTPTACDALPRRALPLATVPPERVLRAVAATPIRNNQAALAETVSATMCLRDKARPPPEAATVPWTAATVPLTVLVIRWSLIYFGFFCGYDKNFQGKS